MPQVKQFKRKRTQNLGQHTHPQEPKPKKIKALSATPGPNTQEFPKDTLPLVPRTPSSRNSVLNFCSRVWHSLRSARRSKLAPQNHPGHIDPGTPSKPATRPDTLLPPCDDSLESLEELPLNRMLFEDLLVPNTSTRASARSSDLFEPLTPDAHRPASLSDSSSDTDPDSSEKATLNTHIDERGIFDPLVHSTPGEQDNFDDTLPEHEDDGNIDVTTTSAATGTEPHRRVTIEEIPEEDSRARASEPPTQPRPRTEPTSPQPQPEVNASRPRTVRFADSPHPRYTPDFKPFKPVDKPFKPNPYHENSPDFDEPLHGAIETLRDHIRGILRPPRKGRSKGYQNFPFPNDDVLHRRLQMLEHFLTYYLNERGDPKRRTWASSSLYTAVFWSRGPHTARKLREWARRMLVDREELPYNLYGSWSVSLLDKGELAQELYLHLQSIGAYVSADDIVRYLARSDVQQKHELKGTISLATAKRWMHLMDYRWTKTPQGQYIDGHEREDVVAYRQKVFLPTLAELSRNARAWNNGVLEARGAPPARWTVIWYHDESTFYANDRRLVRWVHAGEKPVPRAKGEGASLMVADFVSADYGWLTSPDKKESARVLFKPGNSRDGYFTCDEICEQATNAMDILQKHYSDEDHVFIYDNAKTHSKREPWALSARKLTLGPSQKQLVKVPVRNAEGKIIKDQYTMEQMRGATYQDGTPQALYFPDDHPTHPGWFKGMSIILTERGISTAGLLTQCKDFKCAPGATSCCCRRILFNEPDFTNVEPILFAHCRARGVRVMLLPKFHPELNPIEQCWGYAKRKYREMPKSSKEADLERNVVSALGEVTTERIRNFERRTARFMNAYRYGLNGSQSAWAARKYRGHRNLPNYDKLLGDLKAADKA